MESMLYFEQQSTFGFLILGVQRPILHYCLPAIQQRLGHIYGHGNLLC